MRQYICLLIAALGLCSFCMPESNNNAEVINAAQHGLAYYLSSIPPGQEANYGIKNQDELGKCTIARHPYQMLSLSDDFYANAPAGTNYFAAQSTWRVPVSVDGEDRVLLTVTGVPGNYNVVDMGGNGLAKELQHLTANLKKSDTYYLLRVYQLHADFIVDAGSSSLADATFIPATSAMMAIPALTAKAYSFAEFHSLLLNAINNHTKG